MKTNFQNATVYNRASHSKTDTFTVISNKMLQDNRLNVIEKGILSTILSNSDTYVFNSVYFQKTSGIGKDLYNKSIKNLIAFGYIEKKAKKTGGWIWIINEDTYTVTITGNTTTITGNTSNEIIDNIDYPTEEITNVNSSIEKIEEPIFIANDDDIKKSFFDYISNENIGSQVDKEACLRKYFSLDQLKDILDELDCETVPYISKWKSILNKKINK